MPCWLTVYSQDCMDRVAPENLQEQLLDADLATLAEPHGIEDGALVKAARRQLRVTGHPSGEMEIRYREPDLRPIQLHRCSELARVAEELAELRELAKGPLPPAIERHLSNVREIVALELGIGMYRDMGIVLAWEAARIIAHACRGIVKDDDYRWSLLDNQGSYVHLD